MCFFLLNLPSLFHLWKYSNWSTFRYKYSSRATCFRASSLIFLFGIQRVSPMSAIRTGTWVFIERWTCTARKCAAAYSWPLRSSASSSFPVTSFREKWPLCRRRAPSYNRNSESETRIVSGWSVSSCPSFSQPHRIAFYSRIHFNCVVDVFHTWRIIRLVWKIIEKINYVCVDMYALGK